ncbi:MAG: sigma-70 family RNA polymerase sigma factor [Anaerolineales bacterium]|nr:sigma-70 family RNA polymerase sigma factor [Anaerolineales bacterium]
MLSFEELYISYSPEVYRFANWLSGNSNDAEDITAETFTRAWMNFNNIRTETLKAYLFTIARNIHLESLRKNRDHDEIKETHPDSQPGLEKTLETKGELDQIRSSLLTLPEIDRSAFVMRVQHDLPYAEIARVLQLSEGTVKVKVHRVRKMLFSSQTKRR